MTYFSGHKAFVARLFVTRNLLSQCKCPLLVVLFLFSFLVPQPVFCPWPLLAHKSPVHLLFSVSDNSMFGEVFNTKSGGFRLYNQNCLFVYTQLQKILPDSHLGPIFDWDTYMKFNMHDPTLPFKSADDVLLHHDLSDLLKTSRISTPRRLVGQVISFYKYFIKLLLTNDLATSAFVRGLSAFDEPVVRVGREAEYTEAIQLLAGCFVQHKWIAPSVKPVVVSEYCSLITKLRSERLPTSKGWVKTFTAITSYNAELNSSTYSKRSARCFVDLVLFRSLSLCLFLD